MENNITNWIERHSHFQSAGLLDLYDIELESVVPSGVDVTSLKVSNMLYRNSSIRSTYFKEPGSLFSSLNVDLDQRIRLLTMPVCLELARFVLMAAGLRKHTCKLVVAHHRLCNTVSLDKLCSNKKAALQSLIEAPSGASHVIVGIIYSALELIVIEDESSAVEPDENVNERLKTAGDKLEAFLNDNGRLDELPKSLHISYFNNLTRKAKSNLSVAELGTLIHQFRNRVPTDPTALPGLNCSVTFKLMTWADFITTFAPQDAALLNESPKRTLVLDPGVKQRLADALSDVRLWLWNTSLPKFRRDNIPGFDETKKLRNEILAWFSSFKRKQNGTKSRTSNLDAYQMLSECETKLNELAGKIARIRALHKLLDAWEKLPVLKLVGAQLLITHDQLKAPESKRILVFDPDILGQESGEWNSYFGWFIMMINKKEAEAFFLCSIEHFDSLLVSAASEYSKPIFILKSVRDGFRLVLTHMTGAAADNDDSDMVDEKEAYSDRTGVQKSTETMMPVEEQEAKKPCDEIENIEWPLNVEDNTVEMEVNPSYSIQEDVVENAVEQNEEDNSKEPEKAAEIYDATNILTGHENAYEPDLSALEDKAINILLLGETGVGKSTFINAYYNYLTFGSLEDAIKEPKLHGLVCSTFSFTDSQLNVKKVTVSKNIASDSTVNFMNDGIDCEANESAKPGESSTQHAKAYEFKHKGRLIRLIDTPGIGDSRGISTDQANFKQTIEYLSRLDHLNAVCILLKPNVRLMELHMRYCIKELFSNFNKVTIRNLVFCFTNTRSTSFRPGDTFPSLQQFVAKEIEAVSNVKVPVGPNNIFCMDNEAFRYLVLAKNVNNDEERACFNELGHQKTFVDSWQISKEASEKLIKYAQTLPVLKMSEMVAYNQSRSMSLELVDRVIAVLVLLAQSRADLGIGVDNESLSGELLILAAAITRSLSAQSVTIFNDRLDARLEEQIRTCKTSLNERESRIIPSLEAFRAEYKAALQADNDGELTADLNVDAKIWELNSKLAQVLNNLPSEDASTSLAPQEGVIISTKYLSNVNKHWKNE